LEIKKQRKVMLVEWDLLVFNQRNRVKEKRKVKISLKIYEILIAVDLIIRVIVKMMQLSMDIVINVLRRYQ